MSWSKAEQGFSLIELMVAMAISSVIIAGIYNMFYTQQRSYMTQDLVAEMQQNIRAGMQLMARELRSAGYDPRRTGSFGLVTGFPSPRDTFAIDYTVKRDIIAFTMDDDDQGDVDANDNEMIAYRLNNRTLERYSATGSAWRPVADNIDALNFVYLNEAGNPTTVLANIRAVEISILVRADKEDKHYKNTTSVFYNKQGQSICSSCGNNKYRRRLLSTTVYFRNFRG